MKIKSPKDDRINITNAYWQLVVGKYLRFKTSDYLYSKNEMVEASCMQFDKQQWSGKLVCILGMDNASENEKLLRYWLGAWKLSQIYFGGYSTTESLS